MRNPLSFLIFLSVVLLLLGLIHLFLYKGVVRGLGITSPRALWTLRIAAVLLAVSYVVARWMDGWAPWGVVVVAHWISSIWLGLMFHSLWIGMDLWILKTLMRLTGLWGRLAPHHELMGKAAVTATAAAAVVLCAIGMISAYGPVKVRRATVKVKGITPELGKLRIVMAADFHAGALVGAPAVREWVEVINGLEPDLVLLPGDIIDHPPDHLDDVAEAFRGLRAKHGVYACTGNHEYIVGIGRSVPFLERSGVRVLRNEAVEVAGGLRLAGIEDASAPRFGGELRPVGEVLGPEAKEQPTILLHHTPGRKVTERAIAAGADLAVSGHTHGGQVWPAGMLTRLAFPLIHGVYEVGGGTQITTCGIGFWGPPMRLGAPPEVWVIELR